MECSSGIYFFTGDISDCFFCCHTYRSYYISEDKGKTARGKYEFAIGRADREHKTAYQRSRKVVWGYSSTKAWCGQSYHGIKERNNRDWKVSGRTEIGMEWECGGN